MTAQENSSSPTTAPVSPTLKPGRRYLSVIAHVSGENVQRLEEWKRAVAGGAVAPISTHVTVYLTELTESLLGKKSAFCRCVSSWRTNLEYSKRDATDKLSVASLFVLSLGLSQRELSQRGLSQCESPSGSGPRRTRARQPQPVQRSRRRHPGSRSGSSEAPRSSAPSVLPGSTGIPQ